MIGEAGAYIAYDFQVFFRQLKRKVIEGYKVDVGEWHAKKIDNPLLVTRELRNVTFEYEIPDNKGDLVIDIEPNIPWAEDHFMERVSGEPLNPPPSHEWWPWAQHNEQHQKGEKFSHTYPERFWPKEASEKSYSSGLAEEVVHYEERPGMSPRVVNTGIRYAYGDLDDVINLLCRSPFTRQAYLPVWFPEDTGAVHGERVPCTLGYHLMIRNGKLDITYLIRSCDLLRYFQDDVYMACRLAQWVVNKLAPHWEDMGFQPEVGSLFMWMGSLHVFEGDLPRLRKEIEDAEKNIT